MLPDHAGDVIDIRVLYRVPQSMAAVSQFLTEHVPGGMKPGDGGQAGRSGVTRLEYVNYLPVRLPHGIYDAVIATAVTSAGGGSLLRVDAQVAWYPPRSRARDPAKSYSCSLK